MATTSWVILWIKADSGILRGAGFQTRQRVYWSNKATGLLADVPGEAELTPGLRGKWEIIPAKCSAASQVRSRRKMIPTVQRLLLAVKLS